MPSSFRESPQLIVEQFTRICGAGRAREARKKRKLPREMELEKKRKLQREENETKEAASKPRTEETEPKVARTEETEPNEAQWASSGAQ